MLTAYRIVIVVLTAGLRLAAACGHTKARAAWHGRKGWAKRIQQAVQAARAQGRTEPWMHIHCASLGEYEQGAPVLKQWRERHPDQPILLTFFSPSGIEGVQESQADHVDYLPFDQPRAMRKWVGALEVSDLILVKYELWPELIRRYVDSGTRVHLVAARFDHGRHPMGWMGQWMRRQLGLLTTLQVQDAASAEVARSSGINAEVTGDPRVDQVRKTAQSTPPLNTAHASEQIRTWAGGRRLLVVGSAWPPEWRALADILDGHDQWAVLCAPHDINGRHVDGWSQHPDAVRFSSWNSGEVSGAMPSSSILILDRIGILKYAYGLGDLAVVGGGWGQGVHNVLEPAAFGLPVLFGPAVAGFREIEALIQCGAARMCKTPSDLARCTSDWMMEAENRAKAGAQAAQWVNTHGGAALRIAKAIEAAR